MTLQKNILILDDSQAILDILEDYISDTFDDTNVFTVKNGLEGMEIIKNLSSLTLVLSDGEMPQMNGYEFIKQLQSMEKFKKTPVLLLSGTFSTDISSFDIRIDDFLKKPFSFDVLPQKIDKYIVK